KPDEAVGAEVERQRRGRDLHDVAAAVGVEQIGTAKAVRVRLAVVAVADHVVHGPRRRVRHPPVNSPAAALELGRTHHARPPYPRVAEGSTPGGSLVRGGRGAGSPAFVALDARASCRGANQSLVEPITQRTALGKLSASWGDTSPT